MKCLTAIINTECAKSLSACLMKARRKVRKNACLRGGTGLSLRLRRMWLCPSGRMKLPACAKAEDGVESSGLEALPAPLIDMLYTTYAMR